MLAFHTCGPGPLKRAILKYPFLFFILVITATVGFSQGERGSVVVDHLYSARLENQAGEDPTRRVTVYLPPGYETSGQRYPVIYYLHGFTWSDSLMIAEDKFDRLLDRAISTKRIRPVIVVMPDQHTRFRGSFYTNSSFTGDWADFTGRDLVKYIDDNYRTLPQKDARGVAGHSMGGQGAIKMGMLFPEVFSAVYALSPAVLGVINEEYGIRGEHYRRIDEIDSREQLITGWDEFNANAIVAIGQAYTPNPDKPPFYADFPYTYEADSLVVHHDVLRTWQEKSVLGMVDDHIEDLQSLTALKLDWGRNEEWKIIPSSCLQFSKMLENLGINHYAEEYIGDHGNKLWTEDGRALNDMLPFFDRYLIFEE